MKKAAKKSAKKSAKKIGQQARAGGGRNRRAVTGPGSSVATNHQPKGGFKAAALTTSPPATTTCKPNKIHGGNSNTLSTSAGRNPLEQTDSVRLINRACLESGEVIPTQVNEGESEKLSGIQTIAEGVPQREQQLEEIAPRTVDADKESNQKEALWWAGTARLPRAAIVGLALHELESFTEELASKRGTAVAICLKIQDRNPNHLRPVILDKLRFTKKQEDVDSALVGHLNNAWAVLEKLDLLRAAPRAGVYLIGRGQKVFKGFPEWTDVDEPWPKKPTRPPRKPRS